MRGVRNLVQGKLDRLAVVERVHHDARIDAAAQRDRDLAVDGHRQHEAVVVVGVLADQVDATRRANQHRGAGAEAAPEFPLDACSVSHGAARRAAAPRPARA